MANITAAYRRAIAICNQSNVGYSQAYRDAQTVNGITYYDCSSFIWHCLKAAGFDVVSAHGSDYPFTTANMKAVLKKLGFKQVAIGAAWRPGDILHRTGHTEMVYSGRVTMGAHYNDRPLDDQVSINTFSSKPSQWSTCWRYQGGAVGDYGNLEWIKGNRYLNESEMQNNAVIVYSYLLEKGWSINAICGMLGNMEVESTINPGIWQNLNSGYEYGGFGLVQWTPSTNYTDWARSKGYAIDNGYKQLDWIHAETVPEGQWIETDAYPMSFEEFRTSEKSPDILAMVFLKNFERAGVEVGSERSQNALKWYKYLSVLTNIPGSGLGNPWNKKKGYNFILFNRQRRRIHG